MNETELRKRYPRAFKLMDQGKDFLVIGKHEPYYQGAYRTIRINELAKGTWTDEDERIYQEQTGISPAVKAVRAVIKEERANREKLPRSTGTGTVLPAPPPPAVIGSTKERSFWQTPALPAIDNPDQTVPQWLTTWVNRLLRRG